MNPTPLCLLCVALLFSCGELDTPLDSDGTAASQDDLTALRIVHGPLVGGIAQSSATVWLRTNRAATVVVQYALDSSFSRFESVAQKTAPASDFTAKARLTGLPPGGDVFFRVVLDGRRIDTLHRFKTAPASAAAGFSFSVLTDFTAARPAPALVSAMALNPDLMVFLGDLDHRGPTTLAEMRKMHRELRGPMSPFGTDFKEQLTNRYPKKEVPFIHVWDDHDFGPNNSNRTFPGKADSTRAFRENFVLASRELDPEGELDGIYQLQHYGCADLFVLDLRSQRDPNNSLTPRTRTILGAAQKAWLLQHLADSKSAWKIILSTVPFNPGTKPFDSWGNFPGERDELVDFIKGRGIEGVVIISGDIHSGGVIDDGTNSGFPELSVPHANLLDFYDTTRGFNGAWSEGGWLSGEAGAGFGQFSVTPEKLTMTVIGAAGHVRKSLTVVHP